MKWNETDRKRGATENKKARHLQARLLIYRWVSKYREMKSLHNIKNNFC